MSSVPPKTAARHRVAALEEWLANHNARCLWQRKIENVGWVDCYVIGRGVALVTRYRRDESGPFDGWDIFVPPNLDNNTAATLADAERALGLRS